MTPCPTCGAKRHRVRGTVRHYGSFEACRRLKEAAAAKERERYYLSVIRQYHEEGNTCDECKVPPDDAGLLPDHCPLFQQVVDAQHAEAGSLLGIRGLLKLEARP